MTSQRHFKQPSIEIHFNKCLKIKAIRSVQAMKLIKLKIEDLRQKRDGKEMFIGF